jgi:hypothetical protein
MGLTLARENVFFSEDTMGQAGSGVRAVGRLHLSGQRFLGLNFKFPNFWHF